ncbi:hypothetical protein DMUE_0240 [Dictyocoela muelleri]|nr:hypothetical protein DMUE_0240 [Dictyocoela muelleri]
MTISVLNKIFINIEDLMEFLVVNDIVPVTKLCLNCNSDSEINIHKNNDKKTLVYRCINSTCLKNKALINTKFNVTTLVHIIYLLLTGKSYKQLFWHQGISEATIRQIKNRIIHCYYKYSSERPVYLGDPRK